jgi:hypothetical protein
MRSQLSKGFLECARASSQDSNIGTYMIVFSSIIGIRSSKQDSLPCAVNCSASSRPKPLEPPAIITNCMYRGWLVKVEYGMIILCLLLAPEHQTDLAQTWLQLFTDRTGQIVKRTNCRGEMRTVASFSWSFPHQLLLLLLSLLSSTLSQYCNCHSLGDNVIGCLHCLPPLP